MAERSGEAAPTQNMGMEWISMVPPSPSTVASTERPAAAGRRGISLVIPAWHEGLRLKQTIELYAPALASRGEDFEIVVVADDSDSETTAAIQDLAGQRLKLLRFTRRIGKGHAVAAGLGRATFDKVGFVDADAPVGPVDLLRLIDALSEVDCSIGSRKLPGSTILNAIPTSRRAASWLWSRLVRVSMGFPEKDTQFGAKFFRKATIARALERAAVSDWAFDISLLYNVRRVGGSILEVPVAWTHRRDGHFSVVRYGPLMIASLIGFRAVNSPLGRLIAPSALKALSRTFSINHSEEPVELYEYVDGGPSHGWESVTSRPGEPR